MFKVSRKNISRPHIKSTHKNNDDYIFFSKKIVKDFVNKKKNWYENTILSSIGDEKIVSKRVYKRYIPFMISLLFSNVIPKVLLSIVYGNSFISIKNTNNCKNLKNSKFYSTNRVKKLSIGSSNSSSIVNSNKNFSKILKNCYSLTNIVDSVFDSYFLFKNNDIRYTLLQKYN